MHKSRVAAVVGNFTPPLTAAQLPRSCKMQMSANLLIHLPFYRQLWNSIFGVSKKYAKTREAMWNCCLIGLARDHVSADRQNAYFGS
jgi:hypothetical protein